MNPFRVVYRYDKNDIRWSQIFFTRLPMVVRNEFVGKIRWPPEAVRATRVPVCFTRIVCPRYRIVVTGYALHTRAYSDGRRFVFEDLEKKKTGNEYFVI